MNAPVLLTDVRDARVGEAAATLDGWRLVEHTPRELAEAVGADHDARAVLVSAENPTTLRLATEAARQRGLPVVALCHDDAERRRAVELRVDEWYLPGAGADEIALRLRSAVARATPTTAEVAERAQRVEHEEMLYDFLTGLPTLPVVIERSRALIKERGELIVAGPIEAVMREVTGGRVLEIRVPESDRAKAGEILQTVEHVRAVKLINETLRVDYSGTLDDQSEVLLALIHGQVRVQSFAEQDTDLEDIFMRVTKGLVA